MKDAAMPRTSRTTVRQVPTTHSASFLSALSSPADRSALSSPAEIPPCQVRAAFALWVTAVAAGAFETVLAVGRMVADGTGSGGGIAEGLAIRLPVFVAALLIARRMRAGHGWARLVLAIGLGVVGTASMVVGPIHALAQGRSLGWELAHATPLDAVFAASRVVHVSSVLTAVVLMYLPTANAYFRRRTAAALSPGRRTSTDAQ